ncbi:uncharacterized protein [Sinocyclocheilus grahami]|uniref:uncharacterized protein n=1 Tax=Sinocyclocheilus grahami TaxID=75366 RepID=UPI0007ACC1BA|nr:PREDICTED: uncharacterized protein LOC107593710 [Sinocyclocheilus grahami]
MTTKQVNAASFNTSAGFNDERVLHHCECVQLRAELVALKNIVLNLEKDFKDSVGSNLNREVCFREGVDFKFEKVEESIKDAVATLEREVIDCFKRRDKKWAKQLKQTKAPEATISPATATTSPVPPTSTPGFPPDNHPCTSTTSWTTNRATDGEFCATTPAGPEFNHSFSILPFSREQLGSAQGDDGTLQGLSISLSTPATNRIEVQEHQGLLYRRIQKGDDVYKIQLDVPKNLVQQTVQHFHQRTAEKHHGRLKTLLQILEVAWWPSVRSDIWAFVRDCKPCGEEAKECVVINPTKKPPHHPPHHPRSSASTSSIKKTPSRFGGNARGAGRPAWLGASHPGRIGATYLRTPRLVWDSTSL